MRTRVPRRSLRRSSAARVWTSAGFGSAALARRLARFDELLDERFGLAHREAARDDVARRAPLIGFVGERQQRARVPHRQAARRDLGPHFVGQLEQPQEVGDRRAILADGGRDVFLLQVELVGEPAVGERLFDRVQVLALDVFDQRHLEQRLLLPAATSRTTIGTRSRPATLAARQRRSPAMIWKRSPTLRTTIGWMMPLARIDCASSCSRASSTWPRG